MQMFKTRFGIALLGGTYIFLMLFFGNLKDNPENNFENRAPKSVVEKSQLRFTEAALSLGLSIENKFWFPNPSIGQNVLPMLSMYPSVSVYDINSDGYPDILLTYPWTAPHLYINQQGHSFVDKSEDFGLDKIPEPFNISRAVFFDLDNDKKVDLFISRYGCHSLLKLNRENKFVERPDIFPKICSNSHGINFLDYNRDGFMDIFIASYWPEMDLKSQIPLNPNLRSSREEQAGGKSLLIKNVNGKHFETTELLAKLSPAYSNNGAVTDFNDDGYPDLFIANDYGFDSFLINENGKSFVDRTDEIIPKNSHSMNGMNADFADFRKVGLLDFYVGEITAPPYGNYLNLLWVREGDHYVQQAKEYGVGRCGWTWSGKWADLDNDGEIDLIASNGRSRGRMATLQNTKSFRHKRSVVQATPVWLRSLDPNIDHIMGPKHSISAFERNCLFKQIDGKFYDLALESGVTDIEEGYGLALIDFNNDGKMDFIIANMPGRPTFYENISIPVGHWLGISLKAKTNAQAYGATLKIKTSKRLFRVDHYPTNGFNSQSDDRIHLTFANDEQLESIAIRWPSGAQTHHQGLELERYHDITEP